MKKLFLILTTFLLINLPVANAGNELFTPSGVSYADLDSILNDYVEEVIGTSVAGASIVVVKDGEIYLNKQFGYANVEEEVKISKETVFEWGSITKLLVWISVMQLVEQGLLDLSTEIQTYLPEDFLKKLRYDEPITMMNLMHHNAGWEDLVIDLMYTSEENIRPLEEMLQLTEPNQIFKPGQHVAYSNYGVALASYMVERITKQPFYEYVDENIFSVLKMENTTIHPIQNNRLDIKEKRELIKGYTNNLSPSQTERIFIGLYPAGSAIGTIEDLSKLMLALLSIEEKTNLLFKDLKTLEKMRSTSDFYTNGFPRNAHGFWKGMYKIDVLEHAGNTDAFTSNFSFSVDEQLGIIILTNQKNEFHLNYGLPNLIFGEYESDKLTKHFEDPKSLNNSYINIRQPFTGFTKIYGVLQQMKIKTIDESTLESNGLTFTLLNENILKAHESSVYLHLDEKLGKISVPTYDMVPIEQSAKILQLLSIIILCLSVLYWFISLCRIVIKNIKRIKVSLIEWWGVILNLLGLLTIANIIIILVKALAYAPSSAYTWQFFFNYFYIIASITSSIIIIFKMNKLSYSKKEKWKYALPMIISCLISFLIISWEFYH